MSSTSLQAPRPPLAPAHRLRPPSPSIFASLTTILLTLTLAPCLPAAADLLIRLDPLTLTLAPDRPHQTVGVVAENTGFSPLRLGGLDLVLELGGTAPNRPALRGVNLVTGTLFESFNPTQTADPGNDPLRQVWYLTLPSLGLYPEIPAAQRVTLATLELDTTGILSGDFPLAITGTTLGDTVAYDAFQQTWVDARLHNGVLHLDATRPPPARLPDAGANSLVLTLLGLLLARTLCPVLPVHPTEIPSAKILSFPPR